MRAFSLKPEWLYYLQVVAETRSVRVAAEKLFLTEASLRYNLKSLEEHFETPLLQQAGPGLSLTVAGTALLAESSKLLAGLNQVQQGLERFRRSPDEFSLWVPHGYAHEALVPVLTALFKRFPQLQIRIQEATSLDVEKAVLAGHTEIGLSSNPPGQLGLEALSGPIHPGIYVRRTLEPVIQVYLLPVNWQYTAHEFLVYPPGLERYPVRYLGRSSVIRSLCLQGSGIGYLPELYVRAQLKAKQLVQTEGPVMDFVLHPHLLSLPQAHLSEPARFFKEAVQALWAQY